MTEFYIGNRLAHSELNKALGQSLPKLNNKMAETLRSVAMKQGIKKTQQGAKLEFYAVSKEQLDTLTKASTQTLMALKGVEWRPLITVDAQKMTEALRKVNARYTGGMDYKTHQKYLKELEQAVEDSLHKIAEDKKVARPSKPKLGDNPYKVGDLLVEKWKYDAPKEFRQVARSATRIARVSKAYVWLEYVAFKDVMKVPVWANTESAKEVFKNVAAYGSGDQQFSSHGHFIPLNSNRYALEWTPQLDYNKKLVRHRWDKVAGKDYATGLVETGVDNDAEVGYCYSYEPRYD
jgi:hypothetical protein